MLIASQTFLKYFAFATENFSFTLRVRIQPCRLSSILCCRGAVRVCGGGTMRVRLAEPEPSGLVPLGPAGRAGAGRLLAGHTERPGPGWLLAGQTGTRRGHTERPGPGGQLYANAGNAGGTNRLREGDLCPRCAESLAPAFL